MTQTWRAEVTVGADLARQLVEAQFPALSPVSARLLAAGWDNTAFVVNESLVFRFPRRSVAVALMKTEIELLPWLASRVPVKIPVPCHFGVASTAYGWPFAGYPMIRGCSIPAAQLSRQARAALALPLAMFLASLHAIPAGDAAQHGAGVDAFDRLDIDGRRKTTDQRLATLVRAGALGNRRPIDAILETAPAIRQPRTDVLVHGDLHAGQIILGDDHRLVGIIDWGDVHLGDPAVDLAAAHAILPEDSHTVFLRAYGQVDDADWAAARGRAAWHTVALWASALDTGETDVAGEAREALARLASEQL